MKTIKITAIVSLIIIICCSSTAFCKETYHGISVEKISTALKNARHDSENLKGAWWLNNYSITKEVLEAKLYPDFPESGFEVGDVLVPLYVYYSTARILSSDLSGNIDFRTWIDDKDLQRAFMWFMQRQKGFQDIYGELYKLMANEATAEETIKELQLIASALFLESIKDVAYFLIDQAAEGTKLEQWVKSYQFVFEGNFDWIIAIYHLYDFLEDFTISTLMDLFGYTELRQTYLMYYLGDQIVSGWRQNNWPLVNAVKRISPPFSTEIWKCRPYTIGFPYRNDGASLSEDEFYEAWGDVMFLDSSNVHNDESEEGQAKALLNILWGIFSYYQSLEDRLSDEITLKNSLMDINVTLPANPNACVIGVMSPPYLSNLYKWALYMTIMRGYFADKIATALRGSEGFTEFNGNSKFLGRGIGIKFMDDPHNPLFTYMITELRKAYALLGQPEADEESGGLAFKIDGGWRQFFKDGSAIYVTEDGKAFGVPANFVKIYENGTVFKDYLGMPNSYYDNEEQIQYFEHGYIFVDSEGYVTPEPYPTEKIIVKAPVNGSITTPSGKVSNEVWIIKGEDQTFTIKADSGYLIDRIEYDGEIKQGYEGRAEASYFAESIYGTHTLEAFFKADESRFITTSNNQQWPRYQYHTITWDKTKLPDDTQVIIEMKGEGNFTTKWGNTGSRSLPINFNFPINTDTNNELWVTGASSGISDYIELRIVEAEDPEILNDISFSLSDIIPLNWQADKIMDAYVKFSVIKDTTARSNTTVAEIDIENTGNYNLDQALHNLGTGNYRVEFKRIADNVRIGYGQWFKVRDVPGEIKIYASDSKVDDHFGRRVSISGDYAIISSYSSVYIFKRSNNAWIEMGKFGDDDVKPGPVSISDGYAVIGNSGGVDSAGSAYIFKINGDAWSAPLKITPDDGWLNDRFGGAVCIDGDYVIIGARGSTDDWSGGAYIFKRDGDIWQQQVKLAGGTRWNSHFGISVSISGNYTVIGSDCLQQNSISSGGLAFVYKREGDTWIKQAKLSHDGRDVSGDLDGFGRYISIDGDYILVGAPEYYNGITTQVRGAAYIFKRNSDTWNEQVKLIPNDVPYSDFGRSVFISNNYAFIKSRVPYLPAIHVFKREDSGWTEQYKINHSNDIDIEDIESISASGNYVIAGFPDADVRGENSGLVCIYDLTNYQPQILTFHISTNSEFNGSITPSGLVPFQQRQNFNITPDDGYQIKDVIIDNVSIGSVNSYSFRFDYKNHTIKAVFEPSLPVDSYYTINVIAGEHGSADHEGTIQVKEGENQTLRIVPDDGYVIGDVWIDEVPVEGYPSIYTFENVTQNHTFRVFFEEMPEGPTFYDISVLSATGGRIEPSEIVPVLAGENQTFNIIPYDGYKLTDVIADGVSSGQVFTYDFSNVSEDHEIRAVFAPIIGDVNRDGEITPGDALDTYELSKKFSWTPEELSFADFNGDGEITPMDALLIYEKSKEF